MTVLNANQLPAQAGLAIGSQSQPWDVYARTIYLNGAALAAAATFSTTAFSATPTFSTGGNDSIFKLTLTGNVTSSSLSGAIAGNTITFIIVQDGTGGWTFAWPSTVLGGTSIGLAANQVTVQTFIFDGTSAYALAPASIYP